MSWNTHKTLLVTASLIALVGTPALAHAQRGGGGGGGRAHVVVSRPVVVAPYYSGFYDPFWSVYGWGHPGFPGWYPPYFYNHAISDASSARIQVTPRETEVYVDGYLAGVVDDFDGFSQRLRVAPGEHVIELYLDGHKTIAQTILFAPGQSYRIRHAMQPIAAGDASPARPTPRTGGAAPQIAYDAFGRPLGRATAPADASASKDSAAITIRVQPADASVVIDGERWQTTGSDRLQIQVTPGEHRIEIQKDGYQPFSTTIRVSPGETAPLNVSLSKAGDR